MRKSRKIRLQYRRQRKICHSHKSFKTSTKSWINTKRKEMKKTKVKINKPVYLGMSILDISKILMYEFWYD